MTPAVPLTALDGMAERVAIVEDFAQLGFLLVGRHHRGLDRDGAFDEFAQHGLGRVDRRLRVGLDEVEDHRICDETGLHHFGHARDDLVTRQ